MSTFIVYQIVVEKTKYIGNNSTILVFTIIRRVEAENQEEAIGKFVLATKSIEGEKRLEIECIPYENLAKID